MSQLAKELQTFRTEEVFGQHVKQLAELLGYLAYHTHDARYSASGFPDWILLKPKDGARLHAVELKLKPETQKAGRPRADQQEWLDAFTRLGVLVGGLGASSDWWPRVQAHVWRPPDWFDGTIERVLRA